MSVPFGTGAAPRPGTMAARVARMRGRMRTSLLRRPLRAGILSICGGTGGGKRTGVGSGEPAGQNAAGCPRPPTGRHQSGGAVDVFADVAGSDFLKGIEWAYLALAGAACLVGVGSWLVVRLMQQVAAIVARRVRRHSAGRQSAAC